jgi:hypothetical protein
MTMLTQRVVALAAVAVSIALVIWSSPEARSGFVFPRMVSWSMLVMSALLAVMAFKPGKALMVDDIESVPMRMIWPMLLILAGLAFLAPRLGFLSTSFLVFVVTGTVYSAERFSLRRLGLIVFIALCFTFSLYLLFVQMLNVHLPRALLF